MKIRKAVIPVAGLGTRFLPATKSQPKEMLPVVDKPCIQYIIEEAVDSGITDIIFITGRGKRSIEDYFDYSFELHAHLEKSGQTEAREQMKKIENLANFYYVRQDRPLGDGHAILCAKELVRNEPFAVLFGDDFYDSQVPALAQLMEKYEKYNSPVIALQKVPQKEVSKYGVIGGKKIDDCFQISELIEKPPVEKAPSNMTIVGRYIITPDLLETLETTTRRQGTELKLADAMAKYIKSHPIFGFEIEGERFDTGSKLGFLKTVIHFALKHPELKEDFRAYLKTV